MNNVQEINIATTPATLRAVLLNRPDAHPLWHTYMVGLIHLRPIEGFGPPHIQHPDSSHEILIVALDPDHVPDPENPKGIHSLMPPNLVYQLRGKDDAMALFLFNDFVRALSTRALNPDTDYRSMQIAWLNRWSNSS